MPEFFADNINRIKRYHKNLEMVKGNHWQLFENPLRVDSLNKGIDLNRDYERRLKRSQLIYIVINMAALIAKVSADFLFLQPLEFSVDKLGKNVDEESEDIKEVNTSLDEIIERNELRVAFYESALTNAARGDSVWKVNSVDGKAEIIEADPELWFPVTGRNRREYIEHNFYHPRKLGDDWYMLVEKHTVGKIEMTLSKVKNGKGGAALEVGKQTQLESPLSEEKAKQLLKGEDFKATQDTGLDFMPIVHIPNIRFQSDVFGRSDFDDLDTIFMELNIRVSQAANILDKHADPKMFGPRLIDDNGEVDRRDLEYIEVAEGDKDPQYIVWQSSLEHAKNQIDMMVDMALMLSETSKAAFGITDGKVESGEALKIRLIRTLAKIARKRLYYDPGIKTMLKYALKIEGVTGETDLKDVGLSIEWPSGLPEFIAENVRLENEKFSAGTQSLERTVNNLNPDWTQDEIEKEIEKIKAGFDASSGIVVGNGPEQDVEDTKDPIDELNQEITSGILG